MKTRVLPALLTLVLASGCASADTADSTATTSTAPSTTEAEPATTAPAEPGTTVPAELPAFPPAREDLEAGGSTWAVVLAGAADAEDSAVQEAMRAAEEAGYTTGPTDCDEGAAEALGETGYVLTVSVYFETEADAQAAALAFAARGVDGVVAEVRTFCLD